MLVDKLEKLTHDVYFTNMEGVLTATEMITINNTHPGFMNGYLEWKKKFKIGFLYYTESKNKDVKLIFIPVVQKHGDKLTNKIVDEALFAMDTAIDFGYMEDGFARIPNVMGVLDAKDLFTLQNSKVNYRMRDNLTI